MEPLDHSDNLMHGWMTCAICQDLIRVEHVVMHVYEHRLVYEHDGDDEGVRRADTEMRRWLTPSDRPLERRKAPDPP